MEKSFPFNASLVNGQYDRVYTAEDFAAELHISRRQLSRILQKTPSLPKTASPL